MSQPLIETASALLTPIVAVATLYLGYRQYRLEQLTVKQLLYSRRFSVYAAVVTYAGNLARDASFDHAAERAMRSAVAEAPFLFPQHVTVALKEVLDHGVNIRVSQSFLFESPPEQEGRFRHAIQHDQLWLSEAESRFFDLFKPFLALGSKAG